MEGRSGTGGALAGPELCCGCDRESGEELCLITAFYEPVLKVQVTQLTDQIPILSSNQLRMDHLSIEEVDSVEARTIGTYSPSMPVLCAFYKGIFSVALWLMTISLFCLLRGCILNIILFFLIFRGYSDLFVFGSCKPGPNFIEMFRPGRRQLVPSRKTCRPRCLLVESSTLRDGHQLNHS